MVKREMVAYRNLAVCAGCPKRDWCCRIYDNDDYGIRDKSVWFEEWAENFHTPQMRGSYGVEPAFDPLVVHAAGNEHMIKELQDKGIDPYSCEYLGKDGCRIPWEKRPLICKIWKCERLGDKDMVIIEVDE